MKKFVSWDGGPDLVLKKPSLFTSPKVWFRGRKREKRKDKALADLVCRTEAFRLIHVHISRNNNDTAEAAVPDDDDDGRLKLSMTLVRPSRDKHVAHQVMKQGYYAVSHVWGDSSELRRHKTPIVDPEDGNSHVIIRIRPDKIHTMLGLMVSQGADTYWWVDIICAQVSTPLVHMGAIYKQCKACFAMIAVNDNTMRDFRPLKKIYSEYDAALERRPCDLLVPLSAYVPRVLARVAEQSTVTHKTDWYKLLDLVFPQPRPMPTDIRKIRLLDQHALHTILNSSWWDRVWTLQEAVLPPRVLFLNEALGDLKALHKKETFVALDHVIDILLSVQAIVNAIARFRDNKNQPKVVLEYTAWDKFDAYRQVLDQRVSAITESQSLFPELFFDIIGQDKLRIATRDIVLSSVAVSRWKCTEPTDYIYGALGLLDFDIPRMDDPNAVWDAFKKKLLQVRHMDIQDVDLAKATCMADVYGQFAVG